MTGAELIDGRGVNMVLIPAGTFTRGLDPATGKAACERDRLVEEWDCPLQNFTDAAPARDLAAASKHNHRDCASVPTDARQR